MAVAERMEINLTGAAFLDELHTNVGAGAFALDHDWFWGAADLEIWTGPGKTGVKLTEGAGDDYVLSVEDTYLTSESGKTVYGRVQVVNAAYQLGDLYFNGEYIADSVKAEHINELQDQIDALGGAQDRITKGAQTIDAAVEIGDPIFFNVTKETVDLCDVADWTDDAEMTSSVNTGESILSNALNLTKDVGANTVASLSKTVLVQIDFTGKALNLFLYIDDAATLAKLTTLACLTIRYGSDNGNYYQWEIDAADLAVGWNDIIGLTSANADSTTGAPVIASMDYAYLALQTNNAGDTWVAGKAIMDHWFVLSDEEWRLAGAGTPSPQAIYIGSNEVLFAGYTDQFSNLIPGQFYWMRSDGSWTTIPGEAYNGTKLGYAISDTEFIVDIDIEGQNSSITAGMGKGGTVKGFVMGGWTGAAAKATIEDMVFSGETSSLIAATLDTAKRGVAGVSSPTKGYGMGGNTGAATAVIEDIIFADETSQAIAATLNVARWAPAGVFSDLKGYAAGGYTGAVVENDIDDMDFATETSTILAATLDVAKTTICGASSAAKGYFLGGDTNGAGIYTAVISALVFATEAEANIAATLDTAKAPESSGAMSALKGFVLGGVKAGIIYVDVIEDIIFATETSQAIVAVISDTRTGICCVSSQSKAFGMGGSDGVSKTVIDALVFQTETCGAIAATLDGVNYPSGAGVQY